MFGCTEEGMLEMVEAVLDELGLGWLPYPENKPKEGEVYEVTLDLSHVEKWHYESVFMAYFLNGDWMDDNDEPLEWSVLAFRKPIPYQPKEGE
jgi:hypothetical protein